MKNTTFYLILFSLVFYSCYPAHTHTYPTLDGTYVLRSVTINRSNVYTAESDDTTLFHGDFSYLNPAGPLDSMTINKTRIHFSGSKVYTGYYLQNGGDHWLYDYNFITEQDLITGRWNSIRVEYVGSGLNSIRRYMIIEDGLEYLILEGPAEYEDPITGFKCNYVLELSRIGA